jgi:hypothetical protein
MNHTGPEQGGFLRTYQRDLNAPPELSSPQISFLSNQLPVKSAQIAYCEQPYVQIRIHTFSVRNTNARIHRKITGILFIYSRLLF